MSDPVVRLNAALEGRYAIERELGEGGMATVYLADDLKHNRKVALKVLKPELAAVVGAERFLAEIQVTANLTHPHILPLHDSGEADGFLFYVMPYLEGESLRDRIDREKQLPVDEAVRIAIAVANALDHAHRHKVIHRDIKPGNILLQDGEPVVSDFGIALAVGAGGSDRLTETGLSLGTPHYMSPEQATGDLSVGAATDIYALGCVLYEMLVGEPPYTGSTPQAILGKIITGTPVSVIEYRPSVPANMDAAVRRALEKLPADRFTGAQDFRRALADPGFRHGGGSPTLSTTPNHWKRLSIASAVAATIAVTMAGGLMFSRQANPDPPIRRFDIVLPESAPIAPVGVAPLGIGQRALDLSPDGRTLVYVADHLGEQTQLYVRPIDQFEVTPLDGTEGAYFPFFSPDGRWIAFFSGNALHKVAISGGQVVRVADAVNARGGTWGPDDRIVFATDQGQRLRVVSASGGEVRVIVASGDMDFHWPIFLPDGETVLAHRRQGGIIQAVEVRSGRRREVIDGTSPTYLATGHLVYMAASGLHTVRFDPEALQPLGQPVPLAEAVRAESDLGRAAHYAVSGEGTLVFLSGSAQNEHEFVWVDESGTVELLPFEAADYGEFNLSDDGRQLATSYDGTVWILDVQSGRRTRVADGQYSAWGPGDESLIIASNDSVPELFQYEVATGQVRTLVQDGYQPSLSDNGVLAFRRTDPDNQADVWVLEDLAGATAVPFANTRFYEWGPAISPDGRWIAYTSDETGSFQVYVSPNPPIGGHRQISTQPGSEEAMWAEDGRTLYYRAGRSWFAVPIDTEGGLLVGTPHEVLRGDYVNVAGRSFDVGADGRLLVLRQPTTERATHELKVVQNFFEELKQRVGN